MPTTEQISMPSSPGEARELPVGGQSKRPRWVLSVVVAAVVVAAGVVVALLVAGGGSDSPEDIVAQYLEASVARDLDALEALFDPEIVQSYDASAVGGGAFNTEITGREAVLANLSGVWSTWSPTTTSYEVVSVDGSTVMTEEVVHFGDGTRYSHDVVYEMSDDGLMLREDRVVVRR